MAEYIIRFQGSLRGLWIAVTDDLGRTIRYPDRQTAETVAERCRKVHPTLRFRIRRV